MIKFVVLVSLVAAACGLPATPVDPVQLTSAYNYHEEVGIVGADRIKAAEEAKDFDGFRIVGGSQASLGQHPHFGGLIISLSDRRVSVCGSSLVSNTKLITAAHCWFDGRNQAEQFTVVLGSITLFSGGTRIGTRNVVMHESFNPNTLMNNIAIITTNWVTYSNTISPVSIAHEYNTYQNSWAYAVGFGVQSDYQSITTSQTLHYASLRVISLSECQEWYRSAVQPNNICTDGSGGQSTCSGDHGGSLQIGNTLIGISSFSYQYGCELGWPAVFTRVSSYVLWIQTHL